MDTLCKSNGWAPFFHFLKSGSLVSIIFIAVNVAVALWIMATRFRRGELCDWFWGGVRDLLSSKLLLMLLTVEASMMIAAFSPYIFYGTKDEKIAYETFALPCLAALLAGGGLIFEKRERLDPNGWAYVVSALLLGAAFVIFICQPKFSNQIAFLSIPTLVADATGGLVLLHWPMRERFSVDNLFMPPIIAFGLVGTAMGFLFYFFVFTQCTPP